MSLAPDVSELTCPFCGFLEPLSMPEDACVFFHMCRGCGTMLRPKPGDCCVFCSFGSVSCPPKSREGSCEC
jgi:hypothetical protein